MNLKAAFIVFIFLGLILTFNLSCCQVKPSTLYDATKFLNLVWQDEFDTTGSLNPAKWNYNLGDGSSLPCGAGWGNGELQWYTDRPENVRIEDGNLVIEACKDNWQGHTYSSARIVTKSKGDWKYGRFEVRAKMPLGKGIWPAIWMLPTDNVYGGWPASGEMDIMEFLGHETDTIHGTAHFAVNNGDSGTGYTQAVSLSSGTFCDDYHVFSLDWNESRMQWSLDGVPYHRYDNPQSGYQEWPFDQSFHLILNLAVGGSWPGNPDNTTVFPQQFMIDWVRVYQ